MSPALQQPLFAPAWRWRGHIGTSSARFSEDRRYRYELRRTWKPALRPLVVIACNPSTSDEAAVTDPTTKRLLSFADAWGCGSLLLLNIYALCSTDPKALRRFYEAGGDPVGPDNTTTIAHTRAFCGAESPARASGRSEIGSAAASPSHGNTHRCERHERRSPSRT